MTDNSKKYIHTAMDLAEAMIRMADYVGDACEDDSCLVVYGIIRDSGYKIRTAAERELVSIRREKKSVRLFPNWNDG